MKAEAGPGGLPSPFLLNTTGWGKPDEANGQLSMRQYSFYLFVMKQRQEANLIHAAHAPRVFDRVWPIFSG